MTKKATINATNVSHKLFMHSECGAYKTKYCYLGNPSFFGGQ